MDAQRHCSQDHCQHAEADHSYLEVKVRVHFASPVECSACNQVRR